MRHLPILLGVLTSASLPLTAQEASGKLAVADYLEWEGVADPQISPGGERVVYTRRWINKLKDRWESALWTVDADGGRNRFLTKGSGARWSPDGTRIAFLAEGEPAGTQIFVRWMDAEGATTQITRVTEAPQGFRWSPDGKSVAFTMLVEKKNAWDLKMPKAPKGAAWTEPPRLIESTHYRRDRAGFVREGHVHLFVVPADGGTPRALTEGDWNVGARAFGQGGDPGFDWFPDGREIVFDGLRDPKADTLYRESHLYAVDVETRAVRQITKVRGPWGSPAVSRDGKRIAYTGFPWTEQSYKANELWVVERDGSNPRPISGDLDRSPASLWWGKHGTVYFTCEDRGVANVWSAVDEEGKARPVTRGAHLLTLSSATENGKAVGIRTAPQEPPDVVLYWLHRPETMARLTSVHEDVLAGKKLGAVEEIVYESTGKTSVQGWIVKPPGFDGKKKYPLILHIHGGPHSMYNVGFNASFQILAAQGYVLLYTNPRGSTGYGTAFGNAIDNAYPSVDYDDLMAGVDAVLARGYVDPGRLYVTGASGGGVLSSWMIAHTDRFAAAAVRCPVINWISFAGTTDITAWGFYRFRRRPWEDPALWLKHSPLMHVARVKTPTLLMTGELDLRTPMAQTEEYYQALRALGVPTAMVRFNEEYHGTESKPSNFMRTQLYLLEWFGRYGGK